MDKMQRVHRLFWSMLLANLCGCGAGVFLFSGPQTYAGINPLNLVGPVGQSTTTGVELEGLRESDGTGLEDCEFLGYVDSNLYIGTKDAALIAQAKADLVHKAARKGATDYVMFARTRNKITARTYECSAAP